MWSLVGAATNDDVQVQTFFVAGPVLIWIYVDSGVFLALAYELKLRGLLSWILYAILGDQK